MTNFGNVLARCAALGQAIEAHPEALAFLIEAVDELHIVKPDGKPASILLQTVAEELTECD